MTLGYCTNVHAGGTLEETCSQLERHAIPVARLLGAGEPLPIGLWLPASALADVREAGHESLRNWLEQHGLRVFTINGFPYGDFHGDIVKHSVYEPDWTSPLRLQYTGALAELLADLLPEQGTGGVSTLPLGWGASMDQQAVEASARQLLELADLLADLESRSGRCIHVDLEPEPGCTLQDLPGIADFFERHLLGGPGEEHVLRHLRACIDLCHVAVMFEDLDAGLAALDERGIAVGKVQVSNALDMNLAAASAEERDRMLEAIEAFREPRWLHQVVIQDDGATRFHEDLDLALAQEQPPRGHWRVHFHVPIHVDRIGPLGTTRAHLARSIEQLLARPETLDWEVETYAWTALPGELKPESLAEGIAAELQWAGSRIADETGT